MGLFLGQSFPGALHLNSFFKSDNSTGALCGDGYYTNINRNKQHPSTSSTEDRVTAADLIHTKPFIVINCWWRDFVFYQVGVSRDQLSLADPAF